MGWGDSDDRFTVLHLGKVKWWWENARFRVKLLAWSV